MRQLWWQRLAALANDSLGQGGRLAGLLEDLLEDFVDVPIECGRGPNEAIVPVDDG